MAKKKIEEYIPQGITTKIQASSRISLKIKDNFYTIEFSEERDISKLHDTIKEKGALDKAITKEREALWETVNNEVDNQALEIQQMFK